MVLVFIDTNVFFDFLETNDSDIIYKIEEFLKRNNNSSLFYITDYIEYNEVNKSKFVKNLLEEKILNSVEVPEIYVTPPPKNIDLGEWSIYLAIKKKLRDKKCCVLCGDGAARELFSKEELLPCCHIAPPENGVGGTLGILEHLKCIGVITQKEKEEILQIMKNAGRRLP